MNFPALILLSLSRLASEDTGVTPEGAYERGIDLVAQRKFGAAMPFLEKAEKAFPSAPSVLWNLGTASAELGKVESAIAYWKRYEDLAPEDWRVLPKLIQGYQANGDVQSRDREIRALYERRRLHLISDHGLQDAERFCREQFRLAKNTIFAFQYFYPSLQGRWRTHYRFSVFDRATGKEKSSISLVSDGPTLDEDRRPGRTRKYRIERLDGARCWTYTQFEVEPSYDSLRHAVVDILVGKTKPATAIPRRGAAQQGVERDGRCAPAR